MKLGKQSLFAVVAALILGWGAVGVSQATVIWDDATIDLANEADTVLELAKFDSTLGTLTNVYVQFEIRLGNARIQLDNDAAVGQSGTAHVLNTVNSLTASVSLLKSDLDTLNAGDLGINATQVFDLGPTSGDAVGMFNATPAGDCGNWQPGTLTAGDAGNIFAGAWGDYMGSGNFTITVNTTYMTSATFDGSNGYFEGNTPSGELYGKVIYSYIPVPEPTSLGLLSLGALALLRRRRA